MSLTVTKAEGVGVTATLESIRVLPVEDAGEIFIEVKNAGTVALTEFEVARQITADSNYQTIAAESADFTSPSLPLYDVDGDPKTLAAGASAFFKVLVSCTTNIKLSAKIETGTSTVDIYTAAE